MENDDLPAATDAEAAVAVPATDPVRVSRIAGLVDRWVQDLVHNSPVSRETEAMNHLTVTAVPELKRRLTEASL